MKAILVIDMPKDCWDCHLVDEWGNCEAIKITSEKYGMSIKQYSNGERPSWCPLKPFDYRRGALGSVINHDGYTLSDAVELLDEIMGDAE